MGAGKGKTRRTRAKMTATKRAPSWQELLASAEENGHGVDVPTPAEVIASIARSGGDPNKPFFYLAGPMSNISSFNFPRFHEVTEKLRARGYNLVTPAELEDPETLAAIIASPSGSYADLAGDKGYHTFLGRDMVICSLPTCVGGIFLEDWHNSQGALGESWILQRLKKVLYEYDDSGSGITLTKMEDRDTRLGEMGVDTKNA